MIEIEIPPQDWQALIGGTGNTANLFTARDRKLAKSAQLTRSVLPLAERLRETGALYVSAPAILLAEPLAARWYLDLAGLSRKLLNRMEESIAPYGFTVLPETIAVNLAAGRSVKPADVVAFSQWINDVLAGVYPDQSRTFELATCTVLAMMGARIDGQVRVQTGEDAVLILKTLLVGAFARRGLSVEVVLDRGWGPYSPTDNLLNQRVLRFGGRLVSEFIPGGNRPDWRLTVDKATILVGEVKGRTDLSNVWESWMPQINGHLQTWTSENSKAPRLFFGTVITSEMIEGMTTGGTMHTGLRAFSKHGLLSGAYNLSNIAEGQPNAEKAFNGLIDAICRPFF
jgi:hypothetical protein